MTNKTLVPHNYPQILKTIKIQIREAQYQSLRVVNKELIKMYWNIGKTLSLQKSDSWGKSVIENLSKDIQISNPGIKGFSSRNLWLMKQFYEVYKNKIKLQQLVAEIPWGQNLLIMAKIKDIEEKEFYLTKCKENGWSRGILEEKIQFDEFEKTKKFQNNFKKTLPLKKLTEYRMQFKDEYNLSFLNLEDEHEEQDLENGVVKNIIKTLGQLGKNFCFMGRQIKLTVSDKEYFVDLLFYHRKLKSLIAIELKIDDFKPEYSQQLNWYLHLIDKQIKYQGDNPSVGILICKSKNKILVEYALEIVNHPMGVATYAYSKLPKKISRYLPNEEEIRKLIS